MNNLYIPSRAIDVSRLAFDPRPYVDAEGNRWSWRWRVDLLSLSQRAFLDFCMGLHDGKTLLALNPAAYAMLKAVEGPRNQIINLHPEFSREDFNTLRADWDWKGGMEAVLVTDTVTTGKDIEVTIRNLKYVGMEVTWIAAFVDRRYEAIGQGLEVSPTVQGDSGYILVAQSTSLELVTVEAPFHMCWCHEANGQGGEHEALCLPVCPQAALPYTWPKLYDMNGEQFDARKTEG